MKPIRAHNSLLSLIAGFLVLFAAAASAIWLSALQQETASLVRHTLEVENKLNEILNLATDAETGQRGFLLTGREIYLQPYNTAKQRLTSEIDSLQRQTAENPRQQERVKTLRPIAQAKLSELENTVILRTQGKTADALAVVNNDSGKNMMSEIRQLISDMRSEGQATLNARTARAEVVSRLSQAGFIATALLLVAVAFLTLRDARRRLESLQGTNQLLENEINERVTAEGQVRQLQKMEAMGQLTGGIAHDFNNMLSVVIGSLDIARRRMQGTEHPQILKCIDNATEGAERAAVLTARLLAFSRQTPLEPKVLDANKLVGGMSELLRRTLGETIKTETVLSGGLWKTHSDPAQVESALLNLAVNARDAMPDGGKMTIETTNTELDDRYAAAHSEVKAGQYVMISVTDTGVGMPQEVIERAFDPFYTTKGVGKGTGLGLSQVFGFVKQSAGHVKIYSEIGKGTTVKIYLPRYFGSEEMEELNKTASEALPTGSLDEIILVVEDEVSVRHVSVDTLRVLGYTVIQAATPAEALQHLKIQPAVKLLFTDIVMPDMSGRQLADEALKLRSDLKVLYTTGYTRNAVVHNGIIDEGTFFIAKPFTIAQLAAKVRQVLNS